MKDVSWINHPAMKDIDVRKLAVLVDLVNEAEGKPIDQAIPTLLKANTKLSSLGLSFTNEESSVIIEILTKGMSPAEKSKFENMKKLVETTMANKKKK